MYPRGWHTLAHMLFFLLGTRNTTATALIEQSSSTKEDIEEENMHMRLLQGAIETKFCEYYNIYEDSQKCNSTDFADCPSPSVEIEECLPPENLSANHCFVLWLNDEAKGERTVYMKGCFLDTVACRNRPSKCTRHDFKLPLVNCCCEGDLCNANMTFPSLADEVIPILVAESAPPPALDGRQEFIANINSTFMTVYSFLTNFTVPSLQ